MGLDPEPRSLGHCVQERLCVQTAGLPVQTHPERAFSLLGLEPQGRSILAPVTTFLPCIQRT